MGARSLTHIKSREGITLCTIYRQFYGYPDVHGKELKKLLNDGNAIIINGFSSGQKCPEFFNGIACLAAYLIAQLKIEEGIGGIYLYPPDSKDVWEEYTYTLFQSKECFEEICLQVTSTYDGVLYDGRLKDFDPDKPEEV